MKVSMKNFMLLPAARTHADNENDEDEEEYDAPKEASSDCEQGKSLSLRSTSFISFSSLQINECQHLIVEVLVVKVIHS